MPKALAENQDQLPDLGTESQPNDSTKVKAKTNSDKSTEDQ
jgi:hypothetical protein